MVIKVNLLYLCQILKFHNFNFFMTDSLDILVPVYNEDEEASESDLSFNLSNKESKFKIDFNKNEFNSFSEKYSKPGFPTTEFQINLRYKLN